MRMVFVALGVALAVVYLSNRGKIPIVNPGARF
jgi:hypothetical protein